jgi:hypothetical protein
MLEINRSAHSILVTRFFWLAFSWSSPCSASGIFFRPELADIVHHPLVETAIDYHSIKCSSGEDLEESLVRIRHESGVKVIGTEESFLR